MIHEKLEALRLQLNYVCYDKELMPKLSKVWESFFELETEVKKLNIASVMQGLQSDCCGAEVITTELHVCEKCTCSCSPLVASEGDGEANMCAGTCWFKQINDNVQECHCGQQISTK